MKDQPSYVRIRSDKFLKKAVEEKGKIFLLSSYFNDAGEVIHLIFSSVMFINYSKKLNVSNSFINFDYEKLDEFSNFPGLCYLKKRNKKGTEYIKYLLLSIKDNDVNENYISRMFTLWDAFKNWNFDYLVEKSDFVKSYDPVINDETKRFLLEKHNFSCAICNLNKDFCRTKIDWLKTKEAIKDVNLSLPIDFHHFVPRSLFKSMWLTTNNQQLDWSIIHSVLNVLPLCKLCHQSIHNKDKKLSSDTFDLIIDVIKSKNDYEQFLKYLNELGFPINVNELKNFYNNKGD